MNSMVSQVHSLPQLIRESVPKFDESIRMSLDHNLCLSMKRLYVTGCGDSHHAALNTELAFEAIAGIPTEPLTAMQFSRYAVGYLPDSGPGTNVVVGISVSGEVARTTEALNLANLAGATTIALTATPGSRVDSAGSRTVFSTTTPFPDPPGIYTPGIRTFAANQLALFLMAIRIGEVRGRLTNESANTLRSEVAKLADLVEDTIQKCEQNAKNLAIEWQDAVDFVFVGSGPNYGTALFSAAKVLEASGDPAMGQETEEWAHLQYFVKQTGTPTFLITDGSRDISRCVEVAEAAKAVGRRVVAVAPPSSHGLGDWADASLPIAQGVRDVFSPLVLAVPGELFAAYRAEVINEPYFRNFSGGRSVEEGGGISRIRTSKIMGEILK